MSRNKDSEVVAVVLDYLTKQNRPYSVIDIFNNLHKEHGKTAVMRALDDLVESQKIIEKTYGKQKIYYVNQNSFPDLDDAMLKKMDEEVAKCTTTLQSLQQTLKNREAELQALVTSLTTEEAEMKLRSTEGEISLLEAKLSQLKSGSKCISLEEKQEIQSSYEKYTSAWRKRKRMAMNMLDAILEGYPKTKKMLFEEIGIETDEEANVSLAS